MSKLFILLFSAVLFSSFSFAKNIQDEKAKSKEKAALMAQALEGLAEASAKWMEEKARKMRTPTESEADLQLRLQWFNTASGCVGNVNELSTAKQKFEGPSVAVAVSDGRVVVTDSKKTAVYTLSGMAEVKGLACSFDRKQGLKDGMKAALLAVRPEWAEIGLADIKANPKLKASYNLGMKPYAETLDKCAFLLPEEFVASERAHFGLPTGDATNGPYEQGMRGNKAPKITR